MSSIQEQLAAATKAHFDAQLGLINELSRKTIEGAEKVIELNVNVAKASLSGVSESAKMAGTASGQQELLSATATMQPNAEKALDYSRRLAEIAANLQAEFAAAAEAQVAESTQRLTELIDEASRNAPPGSENAIAMIKTVVGNANASYEQLATNAKRAVEALQSSVSTATSQLSQAAETFTQATKK